jgi:hypothetical protein
MSSETSCPQCTFLSRHLKRPTACLLHLGTAVSRVAVTQAYDEPYEFGRVRPSVDRPGPFTLREYTRLLLLRSRVQASREAALTN